MTKIKFTPLTEQEINESRFAKNIRSTLKRMEQEPKEIKIDFKAAMHVNDITLWRFLLSIIDDQNELTSTLNLLLDNSYDLIIEILLLEAKNDNIKLIEYLMSDRRMSFSSVGHPNYREGGTYIEIIFKKLLCSIDQQALTKTVQLLLYSDRVKILQTVLDQKIKNNDVEAVKRLIDSGVPADLHLLALLSIAAEHGQVETMDLLISRGADITFRDDNNNEAIIVKAVKSGKIAAVETLLAQATLEFLNSAPYHTGVYPAEKEYNTYIVKYKIHKYNSPLLAACAFSHLDIVKLLIQHGADVNEGMENYQKAPIYAAIAAFMMQHRQPSFMGESRFELNTEGNNDIHIKIAIELILNDAKISLRMLETLRQSNDYTLHTLQIARKKVYNLALNKKEEIFANSQNYNKNLEEQYKAAALELSQKALIENAKYVCKILGITTTNKENTKGKARIKAIPNLSEDNIIEITKFLDLLTLNAIKSLVKSDVKIEFSKVPALEDLEAKPTSNMEIVHDETSFKQTGGGVSHAAAPALDGTLPLELNAIQIGSGTSSTTAPVLSMLNNIAGRPSIYKFIGDGSPNNLWGLFVEDIKDSINQALEGKNNPSYLDDLTGQATAKTSTSLTTGQLFYAGSYAGNFIVSPSIHCLNDKVNSQNPEKSLVDYYADKFSLYTLAHSTLFSMNFALQPSRYSLANKLLIAKIQTDFIFARAQLSLEYTLENLAFIANSFASLSIPIMGAQAGFYQDHPFAIGVLASTAGDLTKLAHDTAHICYDLMIGKDTSTVVDGL